MDCNCRWLATKQVTYQLKILTTAVFSVVMLGQCVLRICPPSRTKFARPPAVFPTVLTSLCALPIDSMLWPLAGKKLDATKWLSLLLLTAGVVIVQVRRLAVLCLLQRTLLSCRG